MSEHDSASRAHSDPANEPILLTPGPLTTSKAVKLAMLEDSCTWDANYLALTQSIRRDLLSIATKDSTSYSAVLLQGSGTYAIESVLTTAIGSNQAVAILVNGAYGERMVQIAERYGLHHVVVRVDEHQPIQSDAVHRALRQDPTVTHVAFVHCETTSGILNPLAELTAACKAAGLTVIVDAMSSFGGYPLDISELQMDLCVSSANKCIQGTPGFSFVLGRTSVLAEMNGRARTVSLDLYQQWLEMERGHGKWRFTSPTHAVRAFRIALDELVDEGGVEARARRYDSNHRVIVDSMQALGFEAFIDPRWQSHIITSFLYPDDAFVFEDFYQYLKNHGFIIYPGKLTRAQTFRIGNIGDIYPDDMARFIEAVRSWCALHPTTTAVQ